MHRIVFTPSFVAAAREIGWRPRPTASASSASRSRRGPAPSSSPRTSRALASRAVTATFPLIPRRRVLGLPFGGPAQHAPRARLGRRRLAAVPARRRRRQDRLVRVGAALARARVGGVRRPRALRGRGAARRRALRPATVDVACSRRAGRGCRKPEAIRNAVTLIGASATAARGLLGYFDEADGRRVLASAAQLARVRRPRARARLRRAGGHAAARAAAPRRAQARPARPARSSSSSRTSSSRRRATSGSTRSSGASRSFPVIVQDPIWEQSFPDVSGVVVPFVAPDGCGVSRLRR